MAFFTSAIGTLQTLVVALGAGLGVWGRLTSSKDTGTTTPARMCREVKVSLTAYGLKTQGPVIPN